MYSIHVSLVHRRGRGWRHPFAVSHLCDGLCFSICSRITSSVSSPVVHRRSCETSGSKA